MDANKKKAAPSTLTPAQRARKRAADRKFRKSSREKTKSYIAHLEKLVEASSSSPNGPGNVQRLMQQADEYYNDASQLRSALVNIIDLAQSNLQKLSDRTYTSPSTALPTLTSPGGSGDQEAFRSSTENSDLEAMETVEAHFNVHQFNNTSLDDLLGDLEPFQQEGDEFAPFISMPHSPDQIEPEIANPPGPSLLVSNIAIPEESYPSYKSVLAKPAVLAASTTLQPSMTNESQSIWNSLGTITYAAISSCKRSIQFLPGELQRSRDENVLITAVVHGWHSVPEQDLFDPTWQAIRRVDEQMLRPYRVVERLAMLPSQTIIDHLPHAEFYVWPGFRERLFVWPQKYSQDRCLAYMGSCFRFSSPSDPQRLYAWNPRTGLYTFSTEFTKRLKDLRCWTVERRFFDVYPELEGEIPTYNAGLLALADVGLLPPEAKPHLEDQLH
ncbi:hypothetical protein N7491_010286 [Penicillium cf. griseofulvum]|uniref:Uncharacterized protein n=1 Tax=Penicillium cf. griseofulvum TaxID=2972120 RepID=A0A9W9MZJ6_9EURO|nr:hypothetical protein N7472_000618 [Penicillium cf. griseofulvum]KAJ5421841.1 hypothetical protein N7491_010286 [Penicillium cf. griseofulvum]KAJ5428031.1 hypothetical protein N7445_009485 [Penicillium cf. griseofulvum]